jgi:oxygen-independent coproporphyrinogen-3 oxidase
LAGIYIHIPFCKQACYYCDFYFSTSTRLKNDFLFALEKEWEREHSYLQELPIQSIYFGGGTPSILSADEINRICNLIFNRANVDSDAEITLEANPDDLTREKMAALRTTPVNRLSIGIQSFFDEDLQWMNRAHSAAEAVDSVRLSQDAGFHALTLDLIYGVPGMSLERWAANLETFFSLSVPHLSAYSLTVEQNTPLHKLIQRGRYHTTDDGLSAVHFNLLMEQMQSRGFLHYEISNFALSEQHIARHNSSYWKNVSYLGLGPSAHSFNGHQRRWNVASLQKYIDGISSHQPVFTEEFLTTKNQYNEYILTGLRTMWGVSPEHIRNTFGEKAADYFSKQVKTYVLNQQVELCKEGYRLTRTGKMYADAIAADLFLSEE